MNANPEDPVAFRAQVKYICSLHLKAKELLDKGIHLVSTDEKTGIQALERAYPAQPMKLGRVERLEFEYIRHGVVALIANWHIAKGQVITPTVGSTRTEEDFCEHINKTIETHPEAGWIFLVDQLNIHQSESLVRLIAQHCKIQRDFGVKGQSAFSTQWQHEPLFYLMRVTASALSICPNILPG